MTGKAVVVARVPVSGDHVDGLGVEDWLRVSGGEGGGGGVTDPQSGGVTAVVVRVQGARVAHHGGGLQAGQRAAGGLRHPLQLLPAAVVVVVVVVVVVAAGTGADELTDLGPGQWHPDSGLISELSQVLVEHEVLVDSVRVGLTAGQDGLLHEADVVVVPLGVVPHPGPDWGGLEAGVGSV